MGGKDYENERRTNEFTLLLKRTRIAIERNGKGVEEKPRKTLSVIDVYAHIWAVNEGGQSRRDHLALEERSVCLERKRGADDNKGTHLE